MTASTNLGEASRELAELVEEDTSSRSPTPRHSAPGTGAGGDVGAVEERMELAEEENSRSPTSRHPAPEDEAGGGVGAVEEQIFTDTNSQHSTHNTPTHSASHEAEGGAFQIPTIQQNKQVVAIQWNVNGLATRLPELQLLEKEYDPIIFALQETNTDKADFANKIGAGRYDWQFFSPFINGTGLGVDKNVPHRFIPLNTSLQAVAAWVEWPIPATYVSIYIQPHETPETITREIQKILDDIPSPVVLLGDFNSYSELWGSNRNDSRGLARGRAVESILGDNNLVVMNDGSMTRIDPRDGTTSALDLSIASSSIMWRFGWRVENDTRGSDHFPILLPSIETMSKVVTRRPRWRYEAADWECFERNLDHPFPAEPEEFAKRVISAAKKSIPKTSSKVGKRAVHWWTDEVAEAVKLRRKKLRRLRKLTQQDPRYEDALQEFKTARNQARRKIKEAKKQSWTSFVTGIHPSSSASEVWRRVSAMKGNPRMGISRLLVEGSVVDDPKAVAERLADEFYSTSADGNLHPEHQAKRLTLHLADPEFRFAEEEYYNQEFSLRELEWALRTCSGQSAGSDEIGYPMLQHLPDSAKDNLLEIFNNIWISGAIPTSWKEGIVVPIPKPGKNPMVIGNQRPITLVSCVGKLLEKMVNRRLVQVLEEKGVFGENQHGFRSGRGVDSYFADLEEEIEAANLAGHHFEFVALDLTKAYDTAWRLPILKNLEKWKVGGRMARFLKSFLEERSFRVAIGNTFSGSRILENGVPQGTILAVTSFIIRMTEAEPFVPKGVNIRMYADDILLTSSDGNSLILRNRMKKAVSGIEAWTTIHGFRLAADKSCVVHVCKRYKHVEREAISLESGPILEAGSARVLGVYIDSRFNFRRHSNKTKENVELWNRILKTVGGRKIGAARQTLLHVHRAAVQAKLFFGWGLVSNASPAIIKTFESTYNNGIRRASGVFASSPTVSVMAEAGVLPFEFAQLNHLIQTAFRVQSRSSEERSVFARAQSRFEEITGEVIPRIASVQRFSQRNWNAPVPQIDWGMKELVRAGDSQERVAAAFGELKEKYRNCKQLFTDGSVTDDYVGAGIFSYQRNDSIRLPKQCSIFSAEAYAIKEALGSDDEGPIVVFSDSASVLAAVEGGRSRHPWIQLIERLAVEKSATLCWIPGHTGIAGNEEADRLAGSAGALPISMVPIPACDAKTWSMNQITITWERKWFGQRDKFLRRIKPSVLPGVDQINQADQRTLTRLRIGHTRLTHEGIFHKTRTQCQMCNKDLTVEHILVECNKYQEQRSSAGISGNIESILSNDKNKERSLLRFLKESNLYNQI